MKIELEALGKQRYRLRGEMDAETLRRERLRRARAYAPHVHVKGFRPGHVPPELVARQIGPVLDEEAREAVARQALADTLKERSLAPTFAPEFEFGAMTADGCIPFSAEFETLPLLEPKDYLGVEIPEISLPPVSEDDVMAGLMRLREAAATYVESAADRPCHEGDQAICDILVRGEETGDIVGEHHGVSLSAGFADTPVPDIGREVLGMKVGDEKTFTRTVAMKDASGTEVHQEVHVTVRVRKLSEKVLPSLDDDFARHYGGKETLQEWKESLRERLEEKRQKILKEMREDAVITEILRGNPIEVGDETVRRLATETETRVKERLMPGVPEEQRQQIPLGISQEKMESYARNHLLRNLLLDAIARREGIDATPEDLDKKLQEIASEADLPLPKLKAMIGAKALDDLRAQIRHEKTLDMLVRYAVVKPRVVLSEDESPGEAEATRILRPNLDEVTP